MKTELELLEEQELEHGALGAADEPYDVEDDFDPVHEVRDLHDFEESSHDLERLFHARGPLSASKPRIIKTLKGAGKIYDYRRSGLLAPNGGRIRLLIAVEHIPVVPNRVGTGDFIQLASVLKAQGLSLQAATDAEGNVALYTPLDRLCYQARGANQVSFGVEHMHMSTGEPWTKKQLRASAWIWQYAYREFGIPMRVGRIVDGPGNTVRVIEKGHTSHMRVSAAAGWNDRSDPGRGYDWEYVRHCALYYRKKGTFEGA